jgi:hypothetical protein
LFSPGVVLDWTQLGVETLLQVSGKSSKTSRNTGTGNGINLTPNVAVSRGMPKVLDSWSHNPDAGNNQGHCGSKQKIEKKCIAIF